MPVVQRDPDIFDDVEYKGGPEKDQDSRQVIATETREWTIGGTTYKTYLSEENAKRFDEDMKYWSKYAEQVSARPATRKPTSTGDTAGRVRAPRPSRTTSRAIRDWALQQNFNPPPSKLGRIRGEIVAAYYAAHPEARS